jgi:hypothetical protein
VISGTSLLADEMNIYVYNVESTIEVYAETEDKARVMLPGIYPIYTDDYLLMDQDVMLVEAIEEEDES